MSNMKMRSCAILAATGILLAACGSDEAQSETSVVAETPVPEPEVTEAPVATEAATTLPATTVAPETTAAPTTTEAPAPEASEEFVAIVEENPELYGDYLASLATFGGEVTGFLDGPHNAPSADMLRTISGEILAEFPAETVEEDSALLKEVITNVSDALQTSADGDPGAGISALLAGQADSVTVGGLLVAVLDVDIEE